MTIITSAASPKTLNLHIQSSEIILQMSLPHYVATGGLSHLVYFAAGCTFNKQSGISLLFLPLESTELLYITGTVNYTAVLGVIKAQNAERHIRRIHFYLSESALSNSRKLLQVITSFVFSPQPMLQDERCLLQTSWSK